MDMSLLNQLAPNSLTRVDIKADENAPEEGTPNQLFVLTEEIFSFCPMLPFLQNKEASQTLSPVYLRAISPDILTAAISLSNH